MPSACLRAQTSRSSRSGENSPADILCFWHNIDFRGKTAGGLLVTFHITLEKGAELFTCTNSWGGKRESQRAAGEARMDGDCR